MGAKVDITGQKFGMLTAIEPTDQRKNKKIGGADAIAGARYLSLQKSYGQAKRKRAASMGVRI